jgi:hypothetical protein
MAMVLNLSTTASVVEEAREDFFAIDGVMYTLPIEVPAVEGVRYLNDVKEDGVEVAVARLMHRMIGEDGMKALARVTDMKPGDFKTLLRSVQRKVNAMIGEAGLGN